MLSHDTPVSGEVKEYKQLDPGGTSYFDVCFDRCPFPFIEECMHLFVEVLAVCEPMVALSRSDELEVIVFYVVVLLISDSGFRADPFSRVIA